MSKHQKQLENAPETVKVRHRFVSHAGLTHFQDPNQHFMVLKCFAGTEAEAEVSPVHLSMLQTCQMQFWVLICWFSLYLLTLFVHLLGLSSS